MVDKKCIFSFQRLFFFNRHGTVCGHVKHTGRLYSQDISSSDDVEKVDVLVVGGGPSGLSAAIRLKQQSKKDNKELRVVLLEKGGEIGKHKCRYIKHFWRIP